MRCPACSGKLQVVEDVSGFFYYPVDEETGEILWDKKDYHGESSMWLECESCNEQFDYESDVVDGKDIITEVEYDE